MSRTSLVTPRRRPETVLLLVSVFAAAFAHLPNLGQPLLERHLFRQTQTAYTALLYHERGIDLLHPLLPILGPPFEMPMEFPLFQAIASLVMDAGLPADPAMRVTGLTFYLLTAVLTWALVRRLAEPGAALGALLFFLFSPFGIAWGSTSMIEYLATAAAMAFVWAGAAWRDSHRPVHWFVALLAGSLAMLTKITTGLVWVLPLLAYRGQADAARRADTTRPRLDPALLMLVVLPIAAGLAWTRHADAIKAGSEATAWLTSFNQIGWNFGSFEQRLDPSAWLRVAGRASLYIIGLPFLALLPFSIAAVRRSHQPRFWAALGLAPVLAVATFFNVYWTHDYYLAAVSPAIAAILGLGAHHAWQRRRGVLTRSAPLVVVLAVAAVIVGATSYRYVQPTYQAPEPETLSQEIAAVTRPSDLVVVVGAEYSPAVLYYARRWGQMLPTVLLGSLLIARLPSQDYHVLASANPDIDPIRVLRGWDWIGALGPRTYAMGGSPTELRGSRLIASDDESAFGRAAATGRILVGAPHELRCGGTSNLELPVGAAGTWLHLGTDAPTDARIRVVDGLAPLPARSVVVVYPGVATAGETIRLTCSGAESLSVLEVVDAPPPR